MGVVRPERSDQHIDVRSHSSAASNMDRLLMPSTLLIKPPLRRDTGKSLSTPVARCLWRRSRRAKPSSIILVSVIRSLAASAFARAIKASLRFKVVFIKRIIQKSVRVIKTIDSLTQCARQLSTFHPYSRSRASKKRSGVLSFQRSLRTSRSTLRAWKMRPISRADRTTRAVRAMRER
jgi:hypothetical protein